MVAAEHDLCHLQGPNDVLTKLSLTVSQGVPHCPDSHFLLHTEPPFAKLLGDDSFVKLPCMPAGDRERQKFARSSCRE